MMTTDAQQTQFNYSVLSNDIAEDARAAAERIKIRMKRTVEDILEIGRDLTIIKQKLPHGEFGKWILCEFGMNKINAHRFMNSYEKFGNQKFHFETFKPSVIYELSSPSTPDEVITQAKEKAESGENVTVKDVAEWKRKAQEAERRSEEWRQQFKDIKEQLNGAESQSYQLRIEIENLKRRKPEVVEKPIIPEGFSSLEQAIHAKKKELSEKQRQAQELSGRLLEMQQRFNAQTELQHKRAMLMGFRTRLSKFLSETQDYQLVIATPSMSPEIEAELMAIDKQLLILSHTIRKVCSYESRDDVLVGEVV